MLVAFNVTNLAKWGYNETTVFIDPMETDFRPKTIVPADFTDEAVRKKLDNRSTTGVPGRELMQNPSEKL
jgi:bilirubin oxidase